MQQQQPDQCLSFDSERAAFARLSILIAEGHIDPIIGDELGFGQDSPVELTQQILQRLNSLTHCLAVGHPLDRRGWDSESGLRQLFQKDAPEDLGQIEVVEQIVVLDGTPLAVFYLDDTARHD